MKVEPKGVNIDLPKLEGQEFFARKAHEGNLEKFQREVQDTLEQVKQTQEVKDEDIKKLMEEIAKKFDMLSKYLQIDIDMELDIPVAKIIERETKRVIRQIPPDYLLDLMKKIDQMLAVLVEKEA